MNDPKAIPNKYVLPPQAVEKDEYVLPPQDRVDAPEMRLSKSEKRNVEDLYDDDNIFEEIKQEGDIILDQNKGERENEESKKKNKQKTKS